MSYRGSHCTIESESDDELELNLDPETDITENNITDPNSVVSKNIVLRPARLIAESSSSLFAANSTDYNNTIPVVGSIQNNFSINNNLARSQFNSLNNINNNANMDVSITDLKEYLEIIPVFRGEPELLSYFISESEKIISYFYDVQNAANPRNTFITSRIRSKILGEASLYLANKNITTWNDLRNALVSAYADKRDDATLAIEISKLEQGNDTPFEFYKKIHKLLSAQIAYAKLTYDANEGLYDHFRRVALKTLLNGLKDPLGSLMRTKDPADLETALNLLTNNYAKEVNSQKSFKHQTNLSMKQKTFNRTIPTFNYSPAFNAIPSTSQNSQQFSQNNQTSHQSVQSSAPQFSTFKRPFNNGQPSQQLNRPTFDTNPRPTPMSISTTNTYRPPMKQNRPNHQFYNINDEPNDQMNEDFDSYICADEANFSEDYTPYNDFLEVEASEQANKSNL